MTSAAGAGGTVEHRGAQISYRASGPVDAPAVVLLHPAFAAGSLFDAAHRALSARRRVISLDLPGHGSTVSGALTMADAPAVVVAVLDALEIADAHVLGVSLGSLVAQAVAADAPARVRSVTVVGGHSIHHEVSGLAAQQAKQAVRWLLLVTVSMAGFRRHVVATSAGTAQGRAAVEAAVAGFTRRGFRSMQGTKALLRPSNEPLVHPLLVMVGEHDLPVARAAARELHEGAPGSVLVVVPGAGHCVNVDAPAAFAAAVDDFLDRVDRRT